MEKTTDELLKILKSSKSYTDFFQHEYEQLNFSSIAEYLEILLNEKGLKKSDVIQKSNLDKNYAYQIFNGNKTNPSRNKIIMLALGMGLNIDETKKLLKICCLSELYVKSARDSIILFCLENKKDIITVNEMLDEKGLELLE
ncbi:MAG TPA: hypothetical protein DDY98_00295 [Ruminococcaceae bacterium]|nr:hypothetical protein [Oscillospiraceae bacterium]